MTGTRAAVHNFIQITHGDSHRRTTTFRHAHLGTLCVACRHSNLVCERHAFASQCTIPNIHISNETRAVTHLSIERGFSFLVNIFLSIRQVSDFIRRFLPFFSGKRRQSERMLQRSFIGMCWSRQLLQL